jgi:hypothetical protein
VSYTDYATDWTTGVGFSELFFFLVTTSRPALGPTQLPNQWASVALTLGAKGPRREADYSPPSSAEVKNVFTARCLIKR